MILGFFIIIEIITFVYLSNSNLSDIVGNLLFLIHSDMSSTDNNSPNQGSDENSGNKGRTRAIVWEYFEKITGDDGLPKTRCTNCDKVYSTAPNSGTSTMRRHLRKCCPQPLAQLSPSKYIPQNNTTRSNDDLLSDEVRAAKKLKSHMVNNLQTKTDRELVQFIWMNKRNVGLLEQKLPHKANAIKEAIKCYENEIDRRANLNRPKVLFLISLILFSFSLKFLLDEPR